MSAFPYQKRLPPVFPQLGIENKMGYLNIIVYPLTKGLIALRILHETFPRMAMDCQCKNILFDLWMSRLYNLT